MSRNKFRFHLGALPMALALALFGGASPSPSHAAIVTGANIAANTIRSHHLFREGLDLNDLGGSEYTGAVGLRLRSLTTAERDALTCNAARSGAVVYNETTLAVNYCNGAAWGTIAAGAESQTMDNTYDQGHAITVDAGAIAITDSQTGASQALTISGTGIVAGAANHQYAAISSSAAHTTTGRVTGLALDLSGMTVAAGSTRGLDVSMPASTDNALYIASGSIKIDTGGGVTVDDGALSVTTTSATASAVTVVADSLNDDIVLDVNADGITTGVLLHLDTTVAGLTTGKYIECYDGAAADFSVAAYGATTIAGNASGTDALTLTAGDILVTSGNVDLTLGNLTVTDGDLSMPSGNITIDQDDTGTALMTITTTGAARTEDTFQVTSNSTGAVPVWDINLTGATNAAGHYEDVDITGAGAASWADVDVGAVLYTGVVLSINLGATSTDSVAVTATGGAAARTTDLATFADSTTSTGVTVKVDHDSTSSGAGVSVDQGAIGSGPAYSAVYTAASTGNAYYADLATSDVGAGGLVIDDSGNRAWADEMFEITSGTGTGVADVARILYEGDGATDVLTLESDADAAHTGALLVLDGQDAQFQGDALSINLTSAAAGAQGIVITEGGRATTSDLVVLTDAGTSTANALSCAKTGVGSTGACIDLSSTVIAADAAKLLNVSYNGAIVAQGGAGGKGAGIVNMEWVTTGSADDADNSHTYLLDVTCSAAGAATDGDYCQRINASGADVEALHVDAGTVLIDEQLAVGGTAVAANQDFLVTLDADDYTTINGSTTAHTSAANPPLSVTVQAGVAAAEAAQFTTTTDADRDNTGGIVVTVNSTGFSQTGTWRALNVQLAGNNAAGETGTFVAYNANDPANFNAATTLVGFQTGTGFDADARFYTGNVRFVDAAWTIGGTNSAGAGEAGTISTTDGAAGGNAGGAINVTAGAGTLASAGGGVTVTGGASVTGNGGTITLNAGDPSGIGTGGDILLNPGAPVGAGTDGSFQVTVGGGGALGVGTLVVNPANTNPVSVTGTLRRVERVFIPATAFYPVTGTPVFAEMGATELGGMIYDGAAAEEACTLWRFPGNGDATVDVDVDIAYSSETATNDVEWEVHYNCVNNSGSLLDGGDPAALVCAADTVDVAEDLNLHDCGSDIPNANIPNNPTWCKVCVYRDGVLDSHNNDIALFGLDLGVTVLTP